MTDIVANVDEKDVVTNATLATDAKPPVGSTEHLPLEPKHKVDPDASPPSGAATTTHAPGHGLTRMDSNGRRSRSMPPSFFKGMTVNGFKVVPEVDAFHCSEEGVAPHSLPIEALTFEPSTDTVITQFRNGDQERKIHCNIRLNDSELDRLTVMRGEARAQGLEFMPSVTAMSTRFLSRARMDPKKAVKLMKETHQWRLTYFQANGPLTDAALKEDFSHGIVYFIGRDSALRPAIVIRAHRIPQLWYKEGCIDKFIKILIYCMEYFLRYMVVPGKVENLNVIVDLAGLGVYQVPLTPLKEVYSVMSHHYIGRVFKFYVCNASRGLYTIAGVAKSILTDRQKQKLNMIEDPKELRQDFALHQLEKDLGGSREIVNQFYPFPLVPGPFAAGYAGGPNRDAVPDVHDALTANGAQGRLWDPKHSEEENTRLDYGSKAADVLRKCGLPVPPELQLERVSSEQLPRSQEGQPEEEDREAGEKVAIPKISTSISSAETCSNANETSEVVDGEVGADEGIHHSSPKIESTRVCGQGGIFCCQL